MVTEGAVLLTTPAMKVSTNSPFSISKKTILKMFMSSFKNKEPLLSSLARFFIGIYVSSLVINNYKIKLEVKRSVAIIEAYLVN